MKLIVGLGNPGRKYKYTRHNIGFLAIDALAKKLGCEVKKRKFTSRYGIAIHSGHDIILLKPQTYMNMSGNAVFHFIKYYKIDCSKDILLIVDDVNLPFSKIRIRQKGSAGGHNGIQSIIDHLGHNQFPRLRVGVDKPLENMDLAEYVLDDFTRAEQTALPDICECITEVSLAWLSGGIQAAIAYQ